MAEILTEFPKSVQRTESYDWESWFDGVPRVLSQGVDFTTKVDSFRSSAYQAGKRRGVKIRVHTYADGKRIAIQSLTSPLVG
jgi:hypothetical protein